MHAIRATLPQMGSAWAATDDSLRAAEAACDRLRARFDRDPDLLLCFITGAHSGKAEAISRVLLERLRPKALAGTTSSGIVGDTTEIEQGSGLSLLAFSWPGVRCSVLHIDDLPGVSSREQAEESWASPLALAKDSRVLLTFADPFSLPVNHVVSCMSAASARVTGPHAAPVFGGIASGGTRAGVNAFFVNDRVVRTGGVCVTLSGPLHVDCVVSQGCRPIGPTMVITKARSNLMFELSGRPAADVIQDVLSEQSEETREQLRGGLFLGLVVDEYKPRFGRGDFLIRNLVGVDEQRKCVAVGELLRVGQTVRLHVRDSRTAHEDMSLLLDAQRLYDPPVGSLLVTCQGRGRRFFGTRDHDASAVVRAFMPNHAGEELASPGVLLDPSPRPSVPQGGFLGAGEIGPIGGRSFIHGHTACAALFRQARSQESDGVQVMNMVPRSDTITQ